MIEQAAALTGTSMTDYVLNVVVPAARNDVLAAATIQLSQQEWDDFVDILDRTDSPELTALRNRRPEWDEPNG